MHGVIQPNGQLVLAGRIGCILKIAGIVFTLFALCDDAVKYGTASVCIPPSYVKAAKEYVDGKMKICTVIGFPLGYQTAEVKAFEAANAVKDGADEIDMVINIGKLKSKDYGYVENEISLIKGACGDNILKVIIETCLLTNDEIVKMCELVTNAKADYIKTSTGFSTAGATFDAVELMRKNVGAQVKVKAAGGISSIADAEKFVSLGADRLGTSRVVKIVKENDTTGNDY